MTSWLAVGAGVANAAAPAPNPAAEQLDRVLSDLSERYLIRQPEQATFYGLDKGPRVGLKAQLADYSVDHLDSDRADPACSGLLYRRRRRCLA